MGGSSSSKASTSNSTTQIDERLAATDNASIIDVGNVGTNATVSLTDYDAVAGARDIVSEVVQSLTTITTSAIGTTSSAVDSASNNADSVLEFVDTQNRDEDSRTLTEIAPYLLAGVAVIALSGNIKLGSFRL